MTTKKEATDRIKTATPDLSSLPVITPEEAESKASRLLETIKDGLAQGKKVRP